MSEHKTCPRCHAIGKTVSALTLESQLGPETLAALGDREGFRFCATPECPVAYFHADGREVEVPLLASMPFEKSDDPDRLVCFCFEHRVSSLRAEVERTGESVVPADIASKCKAGLDRCEEKNPRGSCCLGQVRAVVKEAQADLGGQDTALEDRTADEALPDCCAVPEASGPASSADGVALASTDPAAQESPDAARRTRRLGLGAAAGAIGAAVLASACCWLPLLLVLGGASAAGAGQIFEAYRPVFLGVTALLLVAGFYFTYRKPKCAPGSACAVPDRKVQRLTRVSLFVATGLTVAMATFPSYVGQIWEVIDARAATAAPPEGGGATSNAGEIVLVLEGMTCEGCAAHIKNSLEKVPGVKSARVDYEESRATVIPFKPTVPPSTEALVAAVKEAGYKATPAPPASK